MSIHPRSVIGPERFDPGERASDLWGIFLLGLLAWLVGQALGAAMARPTDTATTQAAITPKQIVAAGIASSLAVIATFALANIRLRSRGFQKIGLTARSLPRGITTAGISVVIILPLVWVATFMTQEFWDRIGFEHPNAHQVLLLLAGASTMVRWMLVFSAIVLTPIAEELLFRGHLQTAILRTLSRSGDPLPARWGAIVVASVIFTFFHWELWMMPPIFCLSLCLGYVYERTGNLWATILIHASFNTLNIAFFLHEMHH